MNGILKRLPAAELHKLSKSTSISFARLLILKAYPFSKIRLTEAERIGKAMKLSISDFV